MNRREVLKALGLGFLAGPHVLEAMGAGETAAPLMCILDEYPPSHPDVLTIFMNELGYTVAHPGREVPEDQVTVGYIEVEEENDGG